MAIGEGHAMRTELPVITFGNVTERTQAGVR